MFHDLRRTYAWLTHIYGTYGGIQQAMRGAKERSAYARINKCGNVAHICHTHSRSCARKHIVTHASYKILAHTRNTQEVRMLA